MATDTSALTALGFKESSKTQYQGIADYYGMSDNAPYQIVSVFTKGTVTAVVEQNSSPDTDATGEVETLTKHPVLVVFESPKGRVSARLNDVEALAACAESLS